MTNSIVRLRHRCAVWLRGPDTLPLLERLVTNDVSNWEVGSCRYGALLTPQGKVLSDFLAIRTEDGVALDCDRQTAPDFVKRLKLFRLRSDVEISLDECIDVFAEIGHNRWTSDPQSPSIQYTDPRYPDARRRFWQTTHASTDNLDAYHQDRIQNGVPEMGTDFEAGSVFPSDINMDHLDGVDLKKGCFVGQEVVSRMHRRGKIRRRTVILRGEKLSSGTGVGNTGKIGQIMGVANSEALALVRLDRLAKALANQALALEDGSPVSCILPDWLADDIRALENS